MENRQLIRVTHALKAPEFRRKLRGKIPKEALEVPESIKGAKTANTANPSTLIKALDPTGEDNYCLFGIITEILITNNIGPKHIPITPTSLASTTTSIAGVNLPDSIFKLKTTQAYLDNLNATCTKLKDLISQPPSTLLFNHTITRDKCPIEGHPDIINSDQTIICEIKASGKLTTKAGAKDWTRYVMQAYCYASLAPTTTHLYMVLPLQAAVVELPVAAWDPKKREAFYKEMCNFNETVETVQTVQTGQSAQPSTNTSTSNEESKKEESLDCLNPELFRDTLFSVFPIGCHIPKKKSLRATIQGLDTTSRPFQFFFTSQSTKFNVSDEDLAASAALLAASSNLKLYVHSPYLLNLCIDPASDAYVVDCLRKHLHTASAMGCRGVVVHVGKRNVNKNMLDNETALANMRANILATLDASEGGPSATETCPLLLETPAGQGSETLTTPQEFIAFAKSINNPNFGICVDTCHVFAAGVSPRAYLDAVIADPAAKPLLKLIHFNDSATKCGSCVDRHAPIGSGHISQAELWSCATLATTHNIPMLVE